MTTNTVRLVHPKLKLETRKGYAMNKKRLLLMVLATVGFLSFTQQYVHAASDTWDVRTEPSKSYDRAKAQASINANWKAEGNEDKDFAKRIENAALAKGYNPAIMYAQIMWETGWGSSSLAAKYNNFGGIKNFDKDAVEGVDKITLPTKEANANGVLVDAMEPFRIFKTIEEGLQGQIEVIAQVAKNSGKGEAGFQFKNYTSTYATDPNYALSIAKMAKSHTGEDFTGTTLLTPGASLTEKEKEDAEPIQGEELDALRNSIDNTFTVNGHWTNVARDWDEFNIEPPNASEFYQDISRNQRNQLDDWITEVQQAKMLSIIGTIRLAVQLLGLGCILIALLLIFSYLFDRVGVLDFSLLSLVTGGKLTTAYESTDQTFFSRGTVGVKHVGLSSLLIITLILLTISILIFTGKIYTIIYIISTFVSDFVSQILRYFN